MKKETQDEVEKIQQAILEREVEEELQKERLMNFWKKYRAVIIGGIVLIIGVTVGNEIYRSWLTKTRLAESDQFEQAVLLNYTGNEEQSMAIYQNLADSAKTGYKYLAQMRLAQNALSHNDMQQAGLILKNLMNDSGAPIELRNVARLSFIGNQIDTLPTAELQQELQPLLNSSNAFYGSAVELQAILLMKEKKLSEAKEVLTKAIGLPTLANDEKDRLKELLSIIQ